MNPLKYAFVALAVGLYLVGGASTLGWFLIGSGGLAVILELAVM